MRQNGSNNDDRNYSVRGEHPDAGAIRMSALPKAFFRQLRWMIPAMVILTAASWWFTKDIKRQYVADGRILVQLGPEYVYTPGSGTQISNPLMITPDQVVLTEIGIIKNSAIMDQVINQMIASPENGGVGGENFAPKLYEKWVRAPRDEKTDRWNDLVKFVDKSYVVIPRPKSSIVDLVYKHPNPEVSVKTLDAMMTAYQNFRKNKFIIDQSGDIAQRRADTEEQLATIERKIQRLLNKNGLSDFVTEQNGVQKRAEELRTQLITLNARLAAAEASLAAAEDQLRSLSPTIDLYIDDRAAQRLAQAELEKRQLLAKYLPSSTPVRSKEAEIKQLRAQINANGGKPSGGRRVGPNPVYQALVTQRNTFQSQADSMREQQIVLERQVRQAVAKVKKLRELAPAYENLVREKTTIEARLRGLQARETEALVNQKQQENSSENIKIITRPTMARKGRNMQKILFALGVLASGFSILMLGLLRMFLDPNIYGPGPEARRNKEPVFDEEYEESSANEYSHEIPEPIPAAASASAPVYGANTGAEQNMGGIYQNEYMETKSFDNTAVQYDGTYGAAPVVQPYTGGAEPYSVPEPEVYSHSYYHDLAQATPETQTSPNQHAGPQGDIPVLGTVPPKTS